ncbi:TetR/AcrR family transcriptional regulator [Streptomyces olivochromogenes]|uniref:TetR family transcriptional regulator n=1 Tax=Streptomyces olivochromogenes TaxID=1963 RepID=A0A250VQM0_STROL|nr:TetR/AcrR family transcriptional regulator [Streptomyces olivochromogenes]KUN39532.1 TetR family transcriptional regulator [Streptomyces olivochromogenes]GAX56386.1 TetR family transcriptional regulator [Streptomyces olivochromogenes]
MPRPPDPAKRRDLLDQVREYMIRNGLAELSLRPLARALSTSDRMLLYYFGTKERMVAEALALDERRPLLRARSLLGAVDAHRDPAWVRRFMEEVWQQFADPDLRAALPLYLEIMVTGLLRPDRYAPVVRDALTEWKDLLASVFRGMGLPEARARTEAALLVDACFGLVAGPAVEGDWDEAEAAFRLLLDRLEPGWRAT